MSRPNKRRAILEAAESEARAGRPLRINRVAARAGVSRQAVHYHFGGADGLRGALAASGGLPAADTPASTSGATTRERLLDAAVRVLSGRGGSEATIEAIATEAGLTKGAVYHHFEDRIALLRAVAERVSPVDAVLAALASSEGLPVRSALVALARAYHRAIDERSWLIWNLVANTSRDPELEEIVLREIAARGAPMVAGWFRERMAAGELRVANPALVAQAIVGPAFLRVIMGPWLEQITAALGVESTGDWIEAYVDLLLAGIGADPPVSGTRGRPRASARRSARRAARP
ncbi:MAG TPA: TetR/AcrR family transcriptional regulator [Candidatus Limnocylindrales bacterium]